MEECLPHGRGTLERSSEDVNQCCYRKKTRTEGSSSSMKDINIGNTLELIRNKKKSIDYLLKCGWNSLGI